MMTGGKKMKINRIYIMMAIFSAAVLVSCERAQEKDELEAGFSSPGAMPAVELGNGVEINEFSRKAVVELTLSGFDGMMRRPEAGVMTSTDRDFYQSEFTAVKPVDGVVKAEVPVVPGTTNWIMAVASTMDGSSYSRKIAVEVPDVPWYYKIADSYTGTYVSGGTGYEYVGHQVYVSVSSDFKYVALYNFDPYVAMKTPGYTSDSKTVNYALGELDIENHEIKFTSTGNFFSLNSSTYMFAGISSFDGSSIKLSSSFKISISEDASQLTIPWYGLFNYNANYFEELYKGEVILKANK